MNSVTFWLSFAVIILSALLYCCYKSGKPLREKARREAEAKAQQERNELARVQRDIAQAQAADDMWLAMQDLVDRPDLYRSSHNSQRHKGFKYGVMLRFFEMFQRSSHETTEARFKSLEDRVNDQARTIRDLRLQSKAVHEALQLGQPIER